MTLLPALWNALWPCVLCLVSCAWIARFVLKVDGAYARAREERARRDAESEQVSACATAVLAAAVACRGAVHRASSAAADDPVVLVSHMNETIQDLERQGARNPADAEVIRALAALAQAFLTHYRALATQLQRSATLPVHAQSGASHATDNLFAAVDRTFAALDQAVSAYRTRT